MKKTKRWFIIIAVVVVIITLTATLPVGKILSGESLARPNWRITRFLNKVINGAFITIPLPADTELGNDGLGVVIGGGTKIGSNVLIYPNVVICSEPPNTLFYALFYQY